MSKNGTFEQVYQIVRGIPPGQVLTYGEVARLVGNPRLSRVVGYALRVCPSDVPAHRVVKKGGVLAPESCFGPGVQRDKLEKEGVSFLSDGNVDLNKMK